MAASKAPAVQNTQVAAPTQMGGMQQMGGGSQSAIPPQAFLFLIGGALLVGGVYFIVIKPLMIKLGAQTDAAKAADKLNDKVKSQPYWSGAYYKSKGGNTLKVHQAAMFARKLNDCMHEWWSLQTPFGWGTDEDCITGIFGLLGSKGNISMVAEQYAMMFNTELYADMESELNEEELFSITQKISQYAI
jgi:hypothetical protein